MFYKLIQKTMKLFAGHIKVLSGPHVARGPAVAQACFTLKILFQQTNKPEIKLWSLQIFNTLFTFSFYKCD